MLNEFRSTDITWDKATSRIYSPVTANESDENGRKLVVQIVNGGQVEDLTGATLHLYWETRDKAHDGLDAFKAVDLKKGEFELSYTTGMLSNKGVLNANLVLIDAVGRVVSERFKITVTEGIDNDAIQSENSFSSLTQALIDISNLEQNYAPRLNDLTAQLQQTEQELNAQLAQTQREKVGGGVKAEPEDLSATTLGLVTGTGGPINLLSIPQDKSVSYAKLDFLSTTRINLLDKTKLQDGYLTTAGVFRSGTTSQATDFMPVEYGKTYISRLKGPWNSAFYDANKTLIRTFQLGDTVTVTDSNAAYIRITIYPKKTFDFDFMFLEGTDYPDEYIPYQVKIDILDNDFKRLLMSQSYKEEYVNLVDMTGYTVASKGIDANTGLEVAATSKASWFLPVEYGKFYVGNFFNYQLGACYDENKNYLCSIVDGIGIFGIATRPFFIKRSDVKYIRVSFPNTEATPFVGEGMVMPSVITSKETKVKFTSDYFRNSLKKDLDVNRPLSGLKWNALGDSITHAPGKTRSYHSILAGQENIFVRNYGLTGTTIGYDETRPNDAMSIRYTTMDNDADIITVMGGINDMNNPSNFPVGEMADRTNTTFYGALHVLLIGLHKKYIGKRIGYITPLNYGSIRHEAYHKAIHEVCEYYSIPVLDLYKDGLINTRLAETNTAYFDDGLHPNEAGHDVMARKIKQFLLTL